MDENLRACLEKALLQTLNKPDFKVAVGNVGYSLDIAGLETVLEELHFASSRMKKFVPLIRESLGKVRK
jgi:hypothetical protein